MKKKFSTDQHNLTDNDNCDANQIIMIATVRLKMMMMMTTVHIK